MSERYVVRSGPGGTRLAGHGMSDEGRRPSLSLDTTWLARCECGATTEVASQGQARRWHGEHKARVARGESA